MYEEKSTVSRREIEELWKEIGRINKIQNGLGKDFNDLNDSNNRHKVAKIIDHLNRSISAAKLNFSPIQLFYQSTAPTSGMVTGDYWQDSDDKSWWRYSGSAWGEVQDADIVTALNNAATAQATADGKIYVFRQTTAPVDGDAPSGALGTGDMWLDSDDNDKPHRYSGSAWVAAPFDVASWSKIIDDDSHKPENDADKTGDHSADVDALLTQNAPIEADADKSANHPVKFLTQFDSRIRWNVGANDISFNVNTSNGADDTYLYISGNGTYVGGGYLLWRLKFVDGTWIVQNKIDPPIVDNDLAGVVKCGSYVYLGSQLQKIYRFDLDLQNQVECTLANVPAGYDFPGAAQCGMATDGTYLYVVGTQTIGDDDQVIGKFSISGTTLTYVSSFIISTDSHNPALTALGCDGTYLYLTYSTASNKRIRRYNMSGSSYTDFNYRGSPYPSGGDEGDKADIILGIFRYDNKWWVAEYFWKRMTSHSDGTLLDYLVLYLKEITF